MTSARGGGGTAEDDNASSGAPEVTIRRVETSDDWQKALTTRKVNGYTGHSYVGDWPRAGYWKTKRDDKVTAIHIVELCPTDELSGELVGDVTYEAFIRGAPVPVGEVWPWCGRMPISKQEHDAMSVQSPAVGAAEIVARHPMPASPTHADAPPERMQSDDIAKLAEALAAAQGQIEGAVKGRANPHFKSTYADLASVWQACRAALSSNGIAVVQMPESTDGTTITLITTLTHGSGQWMRSKITMKAQRGGPQDMVSLVTYMRRTALAAMVGVAPVDDDDDGEGASGRDTKTENAPKANARQDEALARATEWANVTRDLLDKAKNVADVMELMNSEDAGKKMAWLYQHARNIYDDVKRSQEKAGNRITKAAA